MTSINFSEWTPSDVALLVCFGLSVFLAFFFAAGKPRTWFRDPLGWVIFGYSVTTVSFIGLIAYAIAFEQKVDEPIRLLVGTLMAISLALKIFAVHRERAKGRLSGERSPITTERSTMSDNTPNPGAVKEVTDIWYKGKRVLRTLVQVVTPSFLGFAIVLPMIIQASGIPVDSELYIWLIGLAAGVSAVAGGIARIMAIPAVNAWLIKIGLGSVPASALFVYSDGSADVRDDPKAANAIGSVPSPIEDADRG